MDYKILVLIVALLSQNFLYSNSNHREKTLETIEKIFDAPTHQDRILLFLSMLGDAKKCTSVREALKVAIDSVSIDGFFLEMGVFSGSSINYIASLVPNAIVHGFDSFEGLPEDWTRRDTNYFCKGFFHLSTLPTVASNVVLHKGWFQDTLSVFKKDFLNEYCIAFMHVDCDLYSSTKNIFDALGNNIVDGTIIIFDELYGYDGFENHELKALYDFLLSTELDLEFLAYNIYHEQVVVRIIGH